MAIVTTIGGSTTNSYITVAEYSAYADNFGWVIGNDTAAHEDQLRRATVYINRVYNFVGQTQYQTQSMAWPRLTTQLIEGWPINPDVVPQDIKDAEAELAFLVHGGTDLMATVTGGSTRRTKSKAGIVETETEYASFRETPRFVAVEGLLSPYVVFGGSQIKVMRG
jgi:hypothetical protein